MQLGSMVAETVRAALYKLVKKGGVTLDDIIDDILFMNPDELYDYLVELCKENGLDPSEFGLEG